MVVDKWGIPFWYPTKKTAGVTGEGEGFYWTQNNNFRKDEDSGFLRLGKETDDCELINSSTGEWEFPFLTDGDGLSVSGPTGHHSGGEDHGCQGFTYMVDGNFEVNPPSFRFRKETYHVQYNTDPQTGTWTSPFATGPVTNNWKGIGWVRYNKKDGISPGNDSVVCECWWNDNPTGDITNWKMIKRTEDKGAGKSNWGINSGTCDGTPYQVGTWSNIQFRWKSSASDFSFHPLIPEFNEGDNIHSIGGEDMSFDDSAKRGYGKRADMPRDIEMKGLFKWDGGGAGKCRFKNLSLREIDPTLTFVDNPDTPEESVEPTELQGVFKFQWDINQLRTSPCAGAGGSIFYDISVDDEKDIGTLTEPVTRVGQQVLNSSSPLHGKTIKQLDVRLYKNGTPTTPNISAKIWSSGGSVIYTSPTTIDPSTLTGSFTTQTFDFSANTHVFVTGDRIGIQWDGSSDTHYITCGYNVDSINFSEYTHYDNGWINKSLRDFACTMWE